MEDLERDEDDVVAVGRGPGLEGVGGGGGGGG